MKKICRYFILPVITILSLTACSEWFQDKVDMDKDANNVFINNLFFKKEKIASLDSPVQVFVSQGLYAGKISLTWTEVKNATSYRIERAVAKSTDSAGHYAIPDESDYDSIINYCYKNSFTDTILPNPVTGREEYDCHYFYRITAENYSLNLESDPTSPAVSGTRGEGWLLKAPSNLQADKGKSLTEIKISWEGVPEAVSYKIFRSEKSNGSGRELLDTVSGNQNSYINSILTSEQGVDFYYQVCSQNSNGYDSAYSSIALGFSKKEGAPSTPSNVRIEYSDGKNGYGNSKEGFTVKWEGTTGEKIKFAVYRTSSKDSEYRQLSNKITGTSYEDKDNLETGIWYYYWIQCISSEGETILKSSLSDETEKSKGFLLSPPSALEVADAEETGKVTLIWNPSVGSDVTEFKYTVYSSDTEDGDYTPLLSNITGTLSENNLSIIADKKNFYKITTVNESDLESIFSPAAAPMPSAPLNVTASKTQKLNKDFYPNKNNVYPVLITWNKPSSDNPAGYNVYRSAKPDSSFRKITETPVTETEFIDVNETAKSGVIYYYKVISLNSLGQGKKGNDPEKDYAEANGKLSNVPSLGYGALTRDQWFREYNKTVMNSQKKLTLMHKSPDTAKLGNETKDGTISGTVGYNAAISGLGAKITMPYRNYADYYVNNDATLGIYFLMSGNTDTKSDMSGNGEMSGTMTCSGMYPGKAVYNNLVIKSGAAGGGYYGVTTSDLEGNTVFDEGQVNWLVGEEGR